MDPIDVHIYETDDGVAPFSHWVENLRDGRGRATIRTRIARLRLGNFGDCKAVGGGVLELRIDFGPGYRVYFGRGGKQLVLLLCGGDKRTQSKDIGRAKEFWKEYLERRNG